MGLYGAAVAQYVERVIYQEGLWFDPQLLWSTCRSVTGQDTEPQTA